MGANHSEGFTMARLNFDLKNVVIPGRRSSFCIDRPFFIKFFWCFFKCLFKGGELSSW